MELTDFGDLESTDSDDLEVGVLARFGVLERELSASREGGPGHLRRLNARPTNVGGGPMGTRSNRAMDGWAQLVHREGCFRELDQRACRVVSRELD